ncbi:MAG: hypothetical protein BGO58_00650 [Sphingopyxis sp. 65-8]|nr:MAG: hypothetical protein BGO58_00650 [Sphingopyxis sp. 65-8]
MTDIDTATRFAALRNARLPNFPAYEAFGRAPYGFDQGGPDGEGDDEDKPFEETDFGDAAPGRELVREMLFFWAVQWQAFDAETAASVFNLSQALIDEVVPADDEWLDVPSIETTDYKFPNLVQVVSILRHQYIDSDTPGEAGTSIPCTVAETAALLNATEGAVTSAVERHYWMFFGAERDGSPTIEHEGE